MIFPTLEFPALLPGSVAGRLGAACAPAATICTRLAIIAASYFFYAFWSWKLAFLLLGSVLLNWGVGRLLGLAQAPVPARGPC